MSRSLVVASLLGLCGLAEAKQASTHVETKFFVVDLAGEWSQPSQTDGDDKSYVQLTLGRRDRDAGLMVMVSGAVPKERDAKTLLKDFAVMRQKAAAAKLGSGETISDLAASANGWRFAVEAHDGRLRELVMLRKGAIVVLTYLEGRGSEPASATTTRAEEVFRAF